ncbi:MAG: UDP-glucose 4-epimerase GalE [Anaerolineae bacterium]|nr:UDP-glucose 4-epimerase GalE [Anaerolineae bacterium]
MKVLVTGGAGYIGSHMVDLLISEGYEVVVFDSLVTGHRQAVHPQAQLVIGDLMDRAALAILFDAHDFDGIFHFASYIVVPESMEKPFKYLRDNVVAAANLLEAAVEHGVKRFILSSTAALFDEPEIIPIREDETVIPGSPYGESKAMIERLLYWMDKIYELRYCCLRYFNAAGAHPNGHIGEDHHPESHLIPLVLQVALGQREYLTIYGDDYDTPDGTPIRDYIHILDLATAHILAFEALADGPSRKYNLGNGKGYSVKEIVEVARQITGHPIPVKIGARRAGDLAVLVADSSRIKAELGWSPEFAQLGQIIQTAWEWHRNHPHGYADVTERN